MEFAKLEGAPWTAQLLFQLQLLNQPTSLVDELEWREKSCAIHEEKLGLVGWVIGGLWAGGPANGSAKKSERQQTTPIDQMNEAEEEERERSREKARVEGFDWI